MDEWGFTSEDLYGALMQINFAEMAFRVSFTADFLTWTAVTTAKEVEDLGWL